MPDSFSPFLNRPSIYLDENISSKYEVPYASNKMPKLNEDSDLVQNMLSFLDSLDIENTSELMDVANLRADLLSPDKLQEEIAKKIQEQSKSEGGGEGEDMGEGLEESAGGTEEAEGGEAGGFTF